MHPYYYYYYFVYGALAKTTHRRGVRKRFLQCPSQLMTPLNAAYRCVRCSTVWHFPQSAVSLERRPAHTHTPSIAKRDTWFQQVISSTIQCAASAEVRDTSHTHTKFDDNLYSICDNFLKPSLFYVCIVAKAHWSYVMLRLVYVTAVGDRSLLYANHMMLVEIRLQQQSARWITNIMDKLSSSQYSWRAKPVEEVR